MAEACSVDGCEKPRKARGWCYGHWQRWRKYGDPLAGNPTPSVVVDHPDGTRSCTACGDRLPLEAFDHDKNGSAGRRAQCKPCRSARMKAWYAANRERQAARQRARNAQNREQRRIDNRERYLRERDRRIAYAAEQVHRRRALMAQVPWERGVTVRALRKRDGDNCHYCWTIMSFDPGNGREYVPDKATLEHIVPITQGGGHTFANCVLACWQCNVRKNNRSAESWLAVVLGGTANDQPSPARQLAAGGVGRTSRSEPHGSPASTPEPSPVDDAAA